MEQTPPELVERAEKVDSLVVEEEEAEPVRQTEGAEPPVGTDSSSSHGISDRYESSKNLQ